MIPSFRSVIGFAVIAVLHSTAAAAADSPVPEYRTSLADVYGAYQAVLSRRDACGSAFPQSRGAYETAFTRWHGRHRNLIAELDQRVNMMIRRESKDENDYARNIGKYEGAILRQREEVKQALLQQPRGDLETLCKGLPDFLQAADSDLEKEFAEQLAVVRKRPLARK